MDKSCCLGFLLVLSWPKELAPSWFGISAVSRQPTGASLSMQLIWQHGKATVGCDLCRVICSRGNRRFYKLSQSTVKFYSLHQCLLLLCVIRATPQRRTCPSFAHTDWRDSRRSMLTLVPLFPIQSLSCSFDSEIWYLSHVNQQPVSQDSDAFGALY